MWPGKYLNRFQLLVNDQPRTKFNRTVLLKSLIIIGCALLSAVPVIIVVKILSDTGSYNLHNDYITRVRFFDRMLSGTYDWKNILNDTMYGQHQMIWPVLLEYLNIQLTHWDVLVEIYLGVFLCVLRAVLTFDAFTFWSPHPLRFVLLPLIFALSFLVTQIAAFAFGFSSLQMNLNILGAVLGLWGLARFRNRRAGALLMIAGGFISAWSSGNGMVTWPLYFVVMLVLGYRKRWQYILWTIGTVIAALAYIPVWNSSMSGAMGLNVVNLHFWLSGIAIPLLGAVVSSAHTLLGILGLVLAGVGVGLVWLHRHNRELVRRAAPALGLLGFGALSIWIGSLFRAGLAPWYALLFMTFWLGLVGLAFAVGSADSAQGLQTATPTTRGPGARDPRARVVWSGVVLGIALVGGTVNQDYHPNAITSYSRAPVSDACVRYYRYAPTYCNAYVFQWGHKANEVFDMGQILDRWHLATFKPSQEWTLQGDYLFDTVRVNPPPYTSDFVWVGWTFDEVPRYIPSPHYRHLNLFLHSPNVVAWTVHLPENLRAADFNTAIGLSSAVRPDPTSDGMRFEIYVQPEGQTRERVFEQKVGPTEIGWQAVHIPLNGYIGKTITIYLGTDPLSNNIGDWSLFQYPVIDVAFDESRLVYPQALPDRRYFVPEDVAPDKDRDLMRQTSTLLFYGMTQDGLSRNTWIVGQHPYLELNFDSPVCLGEYTHIAVDLAVAPDVNLHNDVLGDQLRIMTIYYKLRRQADFHDQQRLAIPLLSDGDLHTYTYPLRMLNLPSDAQVTAIKIVPVETRVEGSSNRVQIESVRLLSRGGPPLCQSSGELPMSLK